MSPHVRRVLKIHERLGIDAVGGLAELVDRYFCAKDAVDDARGIRVSSHHRSVLRAELELATRALLEAVAP